ncbi:MAG: hypothetical protein WAK84_09835 [Candidatus Cybelea sp.]
MALGAKRFRASQSRSTASIALRIAASHYASRIQRERVAITLIDMKAAQREITAVCEQCESRLGL